jgi:hypothetical protein
MRRMSRFVVCFSAAIAALSRVAVSFASEQEQLFQRAFATSINEPVTLSVAVSGGSVTIGYSRDDEVDIYASGKDAGGKDLPAEFFQNKLLIEQKENSVSIREIPGVGSLLGSLYSIDYRIDVPYRTEIDSTVFGTGNQTLEGVYGPATLVSGAGDIDAKYVRFAPVEARTGKGNISCTRCFAVNAETGEGNITLLEDGNSKARVKSGRGRIEIGGARGAIDASTQAGALHIKAVPSDDWQLQSGSGNIRLELPPQAKFEIEAGSDSGEINIERDDMQKPEGEAHHLHEQVNGGGKHILIRSDKGSISIE